VPSAPEAAAGGSRSRLRTIVVLGMLSTFGPISLDLYLPALPSLAVDLATTTSAAQLSITACLLGLATGQLVAGPLSDRYGRRRPLVIGLAMYLLASAACAFAPSIEVLLVLRLVQGLSGAAGLVVSRAVARDLYSGRALVIVFSRLILVSGLAPVLAPVIGGQLSAIMTWRGIFGVLAAFGVVLLLAGGFGLGETLPAARRTTGGLTTTLRGFRRLLRDRLFVAVVAAAGLAGASMFAYIAGATFVLQRLYGLSPQGFSFAFGANALGIMGLGQLGGRLAHRWTPHRVLALGLVINLVGALSLLTTVLLGLALPFVLGSLFVMVAAIGMILPTSTALALADYPDQAGAASSLLGLGQYVAGALVAPLVGIAGEDTAVPLGVVAASCSVLASLVFFGVALPALRRLHLQEPDELPPPLDSPAA
jgi:DHA1 family bicyclomycin/chloramphenicol resistance-like MFS transporter